MTNDGLGPDPRHRAAILAALTRGIARDADRLPLPARLCNAFVDVFGGAGAAITLGYHSCLHHTYPSVCRGNHVIVLIDDLDIRVLDHTTGQLIRTLTLDYQALGVKCGNSPENQLPT